MYSMLLGFFQAVLTPGQAMKKNTKKQNQQKTTQSAIASANLPLWGKTKIRINVFMYLLPTHLVSSEKAFGLISHPFQTKYFPVILTPKIFHYLGVNTAWQSMGPAQKESKKGQKHLPIFLKAK